MEDVKAVKKNKNAMNIVSKISAVLIYVLMMVTAISLIVPVIWMIINSFKGYIEYYQTLPFEFGKSFNFDNYSYAVEHLVVTITNTKGRFTYTLPTMLINSFIWAVGGPLVNLLCSIACAYVISRYKFVGRDFIFSLGIVIMSLPIIGAFPSAMMVRKALGVYDNMLLTIITSPSTAFSGMVFLILYAAFKAVPWDFAEAVFIDGGGHLRVFIQIMIPLVLPTCAVLFILGFIGNWNDYETFLIWLPSTANLAFGMYYFQQYSAVTGATTPSILAGFVIVAIPASVLYLSSQKLISAKLMIGGLKG